MTPTLPTVQLSLTCPKCATTITLIIIGSAQLKLLPPRLYPRRLGDLKP